MDPASLAFLLAAGFAAAFFDSIVGGGGALSLPALLALGLPPHVALGTNKLAATGASLTASLRYAAAGVLVPRLAVSLIPLSVVASMVGAWAALRADGRFLLTLVVVAMAFVTAYVLLHPGLGREDRHPGLVPWRVGASALLAIAIGLYDGFLGPGTGTFLLFGFLALQRFNYVRAAGHARVLNFASNAGALAIFVLVDRVDWSLGLPMFGSMVAGGWVGSHVALRHGARWIRPLYLLVSAALMARLVVRLAQGF